MRRVLAALFLIWLFGAAPAFAEWRRAESPNFVLYGSGSESQLRERILLLEDFDRLLRTITTVNEPPSPTKLHVYIVGGHEDLELLRPTPERVVGFYMASPDGIAAFVDSSAQSDGNEILFHEYAHHFMMQYRPNAYPAWYIEGFAEYFATVHFRSRYIDIGDFSRGRIASIQTGWLPMERVLQGGSGGLDPDAAAAFYAQSWLTVHYFFSTPERQAALSRLLVQSRRNPREALQAATGMDPDRFGSELRDYIRAGFVRMRRMTRASVESPPPVTMTTMPRSADELMMFEAALRIGIQEQNEQPYLQRIREAAARYPNDRLAMRVQAHAELLYGDSATADRLLDSLVASAPNDGGLMFLKGMRHLVASRREGAAESEVAAARDWLLRAHRADRNHFPTLYRYAESMRGQPVSDELADAVIVAHQLAPQVGEIRMNAAVLHMGRGEYSQAMMLLGPLVADPHDSGLARAARQLLQQIPSRSAGDRPEGALERLASGEIEPDGEAGAATKPDDED